MPSIIHSGNNNSPNIINQLLSAIQAAVYDIQMFYNNLMGGWSGTFTDGDGGTVTVQNGLVISVEAPPSFKLTWDAIWNALHTTVGDYNALLGSDFTTLTVDGNDQLLTGNSTTFAMPNDAFNGNTNLVAVDDTAESCTLLGDGAFQDCASLTTVSLPACTTVGAQALYGCTALTTASFPACTLLGDGAFQDCASLTTVSLPACTTVGAQALYGCTALTTVSLPACTSLGESALRNCTSLTTVSLPACTNLSANTLRDCTALTSVNLALCADLGGTTGDDNVFDGIAGNTITLTIPVSRQTCNGGNPDGDIVYLAANNTATINYV